MKKITGISLNILKTIHLLFIVLFFGGLVTVLAILGLKSSGRLFLSSAEADLIVYRLNGFLIYYSFLGLTVTALIYGLYTNWGILRHRWIIIKWILLLTIAGIYVGLFSPSINGIVSLSNGGVKLAETGRLYETLLQKSVNYDILLISVLLLIFFISTLKPFGHRNSDFLAERKAARISLLVIIVMSAGFGFMGSMNLNRLRTMQINNPDLSKIADGRYEGEFSDGGGNYVVDIEVSNHIISDVKMTTDRKSVYVEYARPVTGRIVEKQTILVDAVTGATTTSKCIMKAAENAFINAKKEDYPANKITH